MMPPLKKKKKKVILNYTRKISLTVCVGPLLEKLVSSNNLIR